MKAMLVFISLVFLGSPASAKEPWELCLDDGDFSFSADSFLKSARVAKSACNFKFTEIGGKGKKFEVNICNGITQLLRYESIEAAEGTKLFAGSAACPAPLFGADIDPPAGSAFEYIAARDQIYEIFAVIKKSFGNKSDGVEISSIKDVAHGTSETKLACAQYLLDSYLKNCETFTAPPPPPPSAAEMKAIREKEKNLPPGVRPSGL